MGGRAISDQKGNIIFDCKECLNLIVDENTSSIVLSKRMDARTIRYFLYNFDEVLVEETANRQIGFIENSPLVVLRKENKDLFLLNTETHKKTGPYKRIRVYDKHFDPTAGIPTIKYKKLTKQHGIAVSSDGRKYGFLNIQGEQIFDEKYLQFKHIPDEMRETFISLAEKEQGIEYLFHAYLPMGRTLIFFDEDLTAYEFVDNRNQQGEGNTYIKKLKK